MFTLKNHHIRIIIIIVDVVIIIKTTSTSDTEGCNAYLRAVGGVEEALQSCALYVICAVKGREMLRTLISKNQHP